ncbi:MAG: amidohydrolase family protein, partial [Chloroflexota bacterium]|nr:amidohydrolase family protein [Chloroflexota bacterium]
MQRYDLILRGSRILDPANSFDSVSDIGIRSGLIESISERIPESEANRSIDLSELWTIPGQIDTHAHVAGMSRTVDPAIGYRMLARAGTTTVLDMGGTGDNLINGLNRKGAGLNVAGLLALVPGLTIPSDSPSKGEIATTVSDALRQGCIGVKILGGYHPFSSETTADIVSECNQQNAYVAFHIGTKDSGSHLGGLREIPDIVGGGRLHVCHLNS